MIRKDGEKQLTEFEKDWKSEGMKINTVKMSVEKLVRVAKVAAIKEDGSIVLHDL